jgi:hypothetical protein
LSVLCAISRDRVRRVFPTLGDGWRHYRGDGLTAKAEPYDAGHPAVIGWRAAAAADH